MYLKIGMDPFDYAPNRLPVSKQTRNQIFLAKKPESDFLPANRAMEDGDVRNHSRTSLGCFFEPVTMVVVRNHENTSLASKINDIPCFEIQNPISRDP